MISVNDQQQRRVVDKIEAAAGGLLDGVVVAVWGLTFKARTDDLRDSPSLAVCRQLVARGAKVRAFDPTVKGEIADVDACHDAYDACDGAGVLAVLTEWDEFRWLHADEVGARMAARSVVDEEGGETAVVGDAEGVLEHPPRIIVVTTKPRSAPAVPRPVPILAVCVGFHMAPRNVVRERARSVVAPALR